MIASLVRQAVAYLLPPKPPANVFCTKDISLAAYLLYRGAALQGYERIDEKTIVLVLSGRMIHAMVNDYFAHAPILFSPKAYMEQRGFLKRMAWDTNGPRKVADIPKSFTPHSKEKA